VVVGESLRVGADEVIDKAVAVGGSLTVMGHVRGDAVAVGGSVTLRPGARVEGDAVAIGGTVTVEEGAILDGDNVSVGGAIPAVIGAVTGWPMGDRHGLRWVFGFAARLARSVLLFGVALLVAAVFPDPVARVRTFLTTRPGLSSLGGLAMVLGLIPVCVLLAVTIIGIPLIPVVVMFLVAMFLFGIAVSALWLGERLPLFQAGKTPLKAVALGASVLVLVGLVPWIGTLVIVVAALVAAGATLLSRFGRRVGGPSGHPAPAGV
jgi:MFS family permease